jgi:hypothetical protein
MPSSTAIGVPIPTQIRAMTSTVITMQLSCLRVNVCGRPLVTHRAVPARLCLLIGDAFQKLRTSTDLGPRAIVVALALCQSGIEAAPLPDHLVTVSQIGATVSHSTVTVR